MGLKTKTRRLSRSLLSGGRTQKRWLPVAVAAGGLVALGGLAFGLISANTSAASVPITFIGAGDIAETTTSGIATAKLLGDAIAADPNTVIWTSGDNAYENATATDFSTKYHPTWGQYKARTKPVPGNHEYLTANATGYFNYFCPSASECVFPGGTQKKYYSYDVGNWHIVSLNSEVEYQAGSAQMQWLQQDLAANPGKCLAAVWHKPFYNSGTGHGRELTMKPFWDILYAAKADVILNGHEHVYERFDKQSPNGTAITDGIRQFTVGTGGAGKNVFGTILPNSQARSTDQGVLKLTLNDSSYSWQFQAVEGLASSDGGSESCNNVGGDPYPRVSVTAPAASSIVKGADVKLTANASDDSSVAGVQFKIDGVEVGVEDTEAPYEATWDTTAAAEGQHSITAVARDSANQATNSAPVTVTVDNVLDVSATVESRVSASADDAEQNSNASPVLNSTDLELVTDTSVQTVGMRFNNVTVPRGATVTKAYLQFATDETGSTATSLTIKGEATDNATAFTTSSNNVSNRPRTLASASWSPAAWNALNETGPAQQTPDLTTVVREITNRGGWNSGNSMAFIVSGSGKRNAHAYDGSPSQAPLLHVEYEIDRDAPSVPTGLATIPASYSQVNLTWTPSADNTAVTGYRIYRDGVQVGTSPGSSYSDTGLSQSTTYTYTVAAFDAAGNVSAQSEPASASTPIAPAVQTLTLNPTADAYISKNSAKSNFGTATTLQADNSPIIDFLLRFNVTVPSGKNVTSAKLRVFNTDSSNAGGRFFNTSNVSWTETGVNWNNAPAAAATPFATLGPVVANNWYEVTVPNVTTSGTYAFRVKTSSSDSTAYRSKEGSSANAPQLVLTVQ